MEDKSPRKYRGYPWQDRRAMKDPQCACKGPWKVFAILRSLQTNHGPKVFRIRTLTSITNLANALVREIVITFFFYVNIESKPIENKFVKICSFIVLWITLRELLPELFQYTYLSSFLKNL